MIIEYINKNGNLEKTADVVKVPENLEKIGNMYFEKKDVIKKETKKVVEVKEEVKEELDEELFEKAKAFLKEKKVKGFGLLKGQKMIDKALEEGFII